MRRVSKPWHLYPVGLLMGLGFDTATQVALLVLAAGSAAFTLPWYAILAAELAMERDVLKRSVALWVTDAMGRR